MTGILISFFLVITLLFLFNYRKIDVIYLPLMILIDMPVAYIAFYEMSQFGLVFNILRLVIVGVAIVKCNVFKPFKRPQRIYVVLVIYLFLIGGMFTSNLSKTFEVILQFSIGVVSYFIGLNLGYSRTKLKATNKYLILTIIILIFNILISQFLEIGRQAYSDNSIYLGFSNIQASYIFAYFIAISIIITTFFKTYRQHLLILVYCLVFISCILYFRRGAILAMFISILIIFFYKSFNIRKILALVLTSILTIFLYQNNFGKIQDTLDKRTSHELDEESRAGEMMVFFQDFERNPENFIFGNELFNSQDYLQNTYLFPFSLHTDYLAIIHGSGIIGFILFMSFFFTINRTLYNNIKKIKKTRMRVGVLKTQLALVCTFLIVSISGQLYSISSLTFFFLYIGMLSNYVEFNINRFNTLKISIIAKKL